MKKLPKAIPELNGGLFVPKQVVDLLARTLDDHAQLLARAERPRDQQALAELRQLLALDGAQPALPAAADQLDLPDPQAERVARNLLKG